MLDDRPDYYAILGVQSDADAAAIKKAWRKAALASHPDRHPDDPTAEDRFKAAQEAWAVLGDEEKRRDYDRLGVLLAEHAELKKRREEAQAAARAAEEAARAEEAERARQRAASARAYRPPTEPEPSPRRRRRSVHIEPEMVIDPAPPKPTTALARPRPRRERMWQPRPGATRYERAYASAYTRMACDMALNHLGED